jgi:AcrR family transcriptional regulator
VTVAVNAVHSTTGRYAVAMDEDAVSDHAVTLTRRERYRAQTIDEIRSLAMAQVAEGGEAAVSFNAIAKTMAVSPGALYRYFSSRDELIADLVVDAYGDLAEHLQRAAAPSAKPADRLRTLGRAYRAWALAKPNTYRLIFESTSGSGLLLASDRIVPAAQLSMEVFLQALSTAEVSELAITGALAKQVQQWGRRADHSELAAPVLTMALLMWTRLHGLVSLEIGQHLPATGVDPALLFEAELDHLVRTTGLPGAGTRRRAVKATPVAD